MSKDDNPLTKEHADVKNAAKATAEYLATIIHMIRRQMQVTSDTRIATGALLKAIAEIFPDESAALSAAYERHYAEDAKNSETAAQTRQIVAALDAIFPQAKYGS